MEIITFKIIWEPDPIILGCYKYRNDNKEKTVIHQSDSWIIMVEGVVVASCGAETRIFQKD